uniref:NADAR domain-containing protein n=1 Tax=Arcella intermedia TaxID=1963864 RepID=A0A6B2LIP5_9EUKA
MSPEGTNHWKGKGLRTIYFSNLYPTKITIDDPHFEGKFKVFDSTEHYFQMYKYSEPDRHFMARLTTGDVAGYGQRRLKITKGHKKHLDELAKAGIPVKMKSGRPYEIGSTADPQLIVEGWDEKGMEVMLKALRAKFTQHPELSEALKLTTGCWMIEHTKNDKKWGDGLTGDGTNYLGKLLMLVRKELEDGKEYEIDRNWMKIQMKDLIQY